MLTSDELDAFGAGTLHYKGGNGEVCIIPPSISDDSPCLKYVII